MASRNISHRQSSTSSSTFVNLIKQCDFREKEKRYLDKIKSLKIENKKMVTLLKDSERLFYTKLQDAKRETKNLNSIIKQLWPLIKHKVKDPQVLLKMMNGPDEQQLSA